ncbi:MAG: ABC transporter ATP-binding protein [Eubacteriaceae bacterium]|nr:ABC transporter ATP-binding protein [Eubacteriaceae bacterium]
MADIIRLENINKVYGDKIKTQVLFDINLSFEKGSFSSIIGASGSGKSTMMNIMGTLDKPTEGKIMIAGKDVVSLNKSQLAALRNETLGFIFQFHYLLPEFTAYENVLMPYRIMNSRVTGEIKDRASELMDMVGLTKVKDNMANNMSGGQQQRTAIARALMNQPEIILADEPTGNLDSDSTENIYQILRDINEKFETTFVVITHDRRIAEKADRIVEIKDGRISMDIKK